MQRYFDYFRDGEGVGYPGASVIVYLAGTSTLASLYATQGDLQFPAAINNPTTTDPTGFFGFAVPNGVYDIIISGSGVPTVTRPNITITDLYGTFVPSGVLTVGAVAPVVSSGGQNPAISMAAATDAVDGYMTAADHTLLTGKADKTTTISTTSPLQGGGSLAANRTLSIPQAGSSQDGYLGQTDYNNFNTIRADIASTSDAAKGDALVGVKRTITGAVASTQHKVNEARCINVKSDYGAVGDWNGTTGTDDTAALQAAINASSNNGFPSIYVPAGRYKFSKLYFDYDVSLNPGFNSANPGRIFMFGDGQVDDASPYYYPTSPYYATVLESTDTSGNCITLAFAGRDGGSYPTRQHHLENMTLIGNVPSPGYVLYNACGPYSKLHNITIIQKHLTGNGVYWHSSWGTDCQNLNVYNSNGINWPSAGGTGVGFDFGSSILGGQAVFRSCGFEGFGAGFKNSSGADWLNLVFDASFFQKNMSYGFQGSSAAKGISFSDCYWEANTTNHVLIDSAARVSGLQFRGGAMIGGLAGTAWTTGPMVKIGKTVTIQSDSLSVYRPYSSVFDVVYYAANGTTVSVKNNSVQADNTVPASTYLLKSDTANIAVLENNWLEPGVANLKEYDVTKPQSYINGSGASLTSLALAPYTRFLITSNIVYPVDQYTPVVRCYATAAGAAVDLPMGSVNGKQIIVINEVGSTQSFLVRNATPSAIGTGVTLTAGQCAICLYDTTIGGWTALTGLTFIGV